ncbi:synaptogenesis protein syg-2-like [Dreissena polymorpha]|uniref:synaptogenesis protein syg-2-like n=1 Tax=Dreissena polymorpha TaxID=45954 RepID=UPI0022648865|nr:synaptogenesis protein syg-2-like [Dreissena polymorpha]
MCIFLKIFWIVNLLYITGLRSCNISLTSNGSLFELGTTNVTLSCRVCSISYGITFYHNTEFVASYGLRLVVSNTTLYSANVHTNDKGSGEMNLIILKFGTSFSGNYTCSNGGSYHSSIALSHKVSVGSVSLTPALTVISVLPNVALSYIQCVSSEGRPAPSITWYLDNKTPSDYSDDVDLTGYSSSSTVADVTTSILTMTPSTNYHDARIYCNVSNGYGQIMSNRTLRINLLSYPTKPSIRFNTVLAPSSISVIKNSTMTLECSSSGNPEPSFSWTLFNGSIISSSVITFTVATNNNKEQILCSAASVLYPTNRLRIATGHTTVLTMNILNAPETPQFTFQTCATYSQTNHLKVIPGHSVSGSCTSKSEPSSTFLWTPANSGIGDGFFINNVSREHSDTYTCIANNKMNTTFSGIINGTNKSSFYLDVLAPAYALFIGNYSVLVNTTLSVTCPFKPGNPAETRLSWFRGNTSAIGSQQNLSLSNVQLSGEGYYKCRVNNTMDPTGCATKEAYEETIFYMDVQCSPKSSPFAPPITTVYRRRNSSAILSFTIVAYPPPNDASAYVWSKQVDGEWATLHNFDRFQTNISYDRLQTNLFISHLQIDDFTNYSVRVNNHFVSTEQIFVIRANEQPSMPQQLLVVDAMVTECSVTVQWTPGFNGGEDQWFMIGFKKAADETLTYINISATVTQLSIGELVAGTKYEVKMHAENVIGKSDETTVLSVTTKSVISSGTSYSQPEM